MNRFILLLLILSSSYAEQTFAQGMEFEATTQKEALNKAQKYNS